MPHHEDDRRPAAPDAAPVEPGRSGPAPDDARTPHTPQAQGAPQAPAAPQPPGTPRGPGSLSASTFTPHNPFGGRLRPLLRRRGVFLAEERVDPQEGEQPAADTTPQVALRSPVATGFLLTAGVFLALFVVGILQANGQLIGWITASLFIALGLDPIVRRIVRWGAPRWAGVLAAALGLAAVAAAFVSLLVPTVVEQSAQLATDLPATVEEVMATPWFQALDSQLHIQHAVQDFAQGLTADGANVTELFGGLVGIGQTVINAVLSVIVVVVLTLYFLASLPHMKYWVYRLAPRSKRPTVEALGEEITSSVGHYVMGQTLVAVLNGTVAFIAMSIAGTPFPVLLAFLAAILAFIPLVGAVIGGTLLTLVSLLQSWEAAALFAAIYFIYLQVEAYVVSPRVMARAVAVPAAVAVIAVIAGGTLLGILGALMAIPTAAALLLIIREVFVPRQDAR